MDASVLLASCLVPSLQTAATGMGQAALGRLFPPQLKVSGDSLTHTQRFYLLGDSEFSQVDSADSPSGWSQIEPPAFLHPRQCLGTVLNSVMRILRTLGNLGICSAFRTS